MQENSTMSSSLSSIRQVENSFDGEREGHPENVAQSPDGMDSSSQGTGFRGKLRRFWQRTRIPSVVKKVMEGSKLLLNRFNLRPTPHPPSPEPAPGMNDTVAPRLEIVKFPEYMIPSPADSSNEAYHSVSVLAPTPAGHPAANDHVTASKTTTPETSNERYGEPRYRETVGKQKSFPEIKQGVVSSRVKWLEPLLSGGKAGDKNVSLRENKIGQDAQDKETENAQQALEIHESSGLAPMMVEDGAANSPWSIESDEKCTFDDSPRLFKHRLPKEEPKPWVEPGTVTKGAMWLQPVLSGAKRTGSGDSNQADLTSPTRITHAEFR